jgi:hypothetical protein
VRSNHGIQLNLELKTQNTHSFPPLNPQTKFAQTIVSHKNPTTAPTMLLSNLTKIVATHTISTKSSQKKRKRGERFITTSPKPVLVPLLFLNHSIAIVLLPPNHTLSLEVGHFISDINFLMVGPFCIVFSALF